MRTKRARVHVGRALAQHYPDAAPLGQSPIRCILPTDTETESALRAAPPLIGAKGVAESTSIRGPRGLRRLSSDNASFSG
jgi:hypothetical protein